MLGKIKRYLEVAKTEKDKIERKVLRNYRTFSDYQVIVLGPISIVHAGLWPIGIMGTDEKVQISDGVTPQDKLPYVTVDKETKRLKVVQFV